MKYDIVLREKPFVNGLLKNDVTELFEKVKDGEAKDEAEALRIAENELRTDRYKPIADTHYDDIEIESSEE